MAADSFATSSKEKKVIHTLNTSKSRIWFAFLLLFILVFPKAGIKAGDLPITVGHTLLAMSAMFCLFRPYHIVNTPRLIALLSLMPIQICILGSALLNSVSETSYFISLLTGLFFLPWIFLAIFAHAIETIDTAILFRWLRRAIFFLSLYGIAVFVIRIVTGRLLVIPLLAANWGDADALEMTKRIVRGDWIKLISTYQNGNIFGISLLILMPLYTLIETSGWKKTITKTALILTLSRTIWIGLVIVLVIEYLFQRKITVRRLVFFGLQLAVGVSFLSWIFFYLNIDLAFLLDSSFGGRSVQFEILQQFSLLEMRPVREIAEVVYMGMLSQFGVIGLITFIIALATPIWLCLAHRRQQDPLKDSCAFGLLTYLIIAWSDGAIQHIPVMALYWGVSSLALSSRSITKQGDILSQDGQTLPQNCPCP